MTSKINDISDYQFISQLSALPFVESISLFGLRARGDALTHSDIDLAITLSQDNPIHWHKVLDVIEHADTLLRIDCINYHQANKALRQRISQQGSILYERKTT